MLHGLSEETLRHAASCMDMNVKAQGALKGTNLRGQTEPRRRFSLIFADSRLLSEKEMQIFAENC